MIVASDMQQAILLLQLAVRIFILLPLVTLSNGSTYMTLPQTSLYIQPHIHMCVLWGYIEAFSKVGILLGKEGAQICEKAHHF